MAHEHVEKLDPRENHFFIAGTVDGLNLFLRHLAPASLKSTPVKVVLYVHGMSFPSALSIAHRFGGRSWRDNLCGAGFEVWALDFYGFGASDRYVEMDQPSDLNAPLGRAEDLSRQIEHAVEFICTQNEAPRISIIAHSAGTIATGRFANRRPDLIERLVFFAPICRRERQGGSESEDLPAWRLVSTQDQWDRFVQDVPLGETPVLSTNHFHDWSERYLASDRESHTRSPASVKIPSGLAQEIRAAWNNEFGYQPGLITSPVAIIRGEWDSACTDRDARWLFDALKSSPVKRDVKINRATHLMHLEDSRYALYRETQAFLDGGDQPGQNKNQK